MLASFVAKQKLFSFGFQNLLCFVITFSRCIWTNLWNVIKSIHETALTTNWNIVSLLSIHKTFKETTNSIVMPFSHLRLVTSICEPLCIWTCVCPHMCLIHMLNINWKHKFTFQYMSNKIEHRTKIRKKQRNNLYHQLYAYWPDGWVSKSDLYRLFNCSQSHFSN